jgi:hypothetical protein
VVVRGVASDGASIAVRPRDANDRPWPTGSAPALRATEATTTATTARTDGQLGKALVRTSENAELVAEGKRLEQQVSTRRLG